MTIIDRSVIINADAQTIWNLAIDSSRISEWFEGLDEQIVDENWPAVGTTGTNVYSAAGMRLENKLKITEYEEAHIITLELSGMLNGKFTWTYTENNGQTTVQAYLDYELAGGVIGKLANKLMFERTNESNLEKTLQNLKTATEP